MNNTQHSYAPLKPTKAEQNGCRQRLEGYLSCQQRIPLAVACSESLGKNIMKTIILAWIATAALGGAAIIVGGKGFFPVMVQVVDADSGTPIKGAIVRLEDAGDYRESEIDPKRQTKVFPESLGKPVTTNTEGVSVVFYFGGFSDSTINGKTQYSRPLVGTVVVEYEGKEIYRSSLKDWAEKNHFKSDTYSVPWIVVSPPPPK